MKKNILLKLLTITSVILVAALCLTCVFGASDVGYAEGGATADALELWSAGLPTTLEARTAIWPSYYKTVAEGGNAGTQADPYRIGTAEQLALFAALVREGNYVLGTNSELFSTNSFSGKHIVLTDDIDLSGKNWTPIGIAATDSNTSQRRPFLGTFDGGSYGSDGEYIERHIIKNLVIDTSLSSYSNTLSLGLFAYLGSASKADNSSVEGTVKNLELSNVSINTASATYVGAIAGVCSGQIENCTVSSGSVTLTTSTNEPIVGGLIGYSRFSDIVNCNNYADVVGMNYVGGIVGRQVCATVPGEAKESSRTSIIENCVNYGDVKGHVVGGIAGQIDGLGVLSTTLRRVGNEGNVTAAQIGTVTKALSAGGILGTALSGYLIGSYNLGAINSTATSVSVNAGGLIGSCQITVDASFSAGNVKSSQTGSSHSGALFGTIVNVVATHNDWFTAPTQEGAVGVASGSTLTTAQDDKYKLKSYEDLTSSNAASNLYWSNVKDAQGKPYWYYVTGVLPKLTISNATFLVKTTDSSLVYNNENKIFKITSKSAIDSTPIIDSYAISVYTGSAAVLANRIQNTTITGMQSNNGIETFNSVINNAGDYYIYISMQTKDNYFEGGFNLTIEKREVLIQPKSANVSYGVKQLLFDDSFYTVVNPDVYTSLGHTISGQLTRAEGSRVSSYNYALGGSNPLCILNANSSVNNNYKFSLVGSAVYRIDQKVLTPNDFVIELNYGDLLSGLSNLEAKITFASGEIVSGDTVTVASVNLSSAIEASVGSSNRASVGDYLNDISINNISLDSVSSQNYTVNKSVKGTLTIKRVALTITSIAQKNIKSLGSEFSFSSFGYQITGWKNNDNVNTIGAKFSFTSAGAAAASVVGEYDIFINAYDSADISENASVSGDYLNFKNYYVLTTNRVGIIKVQDNTVRVTLKISSFVVDSKEFDGTMTATYQNNSVVWINEGTSEVLTDDWFTTNGGSKPIISLLFSTARAATPATCNVSIEAPSNATYAIGTSSYQVTTASISKLDVSITFGTTYIEYGLAQPTKWVLNYNFFNSSASHEEGEPITAENYPLIYNALNNRYKATVANYDARYANLQIGDNNLIVTSPILGYEPNSVDSFIHHEDLISTIGTIHVTKRTLTAPVLNVTGRAYDGTTTVWQATNNGYNVVSGLDASENIDGVGYIVKNLNYSSKDVGSVTVFVSAANFELTGNMAGYYVIDPSTSQSFTVDIVKRKIKMVYVGSYTHNYGYVIDIADFNYNIEDVQSYSSIASPLVDELEYIKSNIALFCGGGDGSVPSVGSYAISAVVDDMSNYTMQNTVAPKLKIESQKLEVARFLSTATDSFTYGDNIIIPEAYLGDVRLSASSGVTYSFSYKNKDTNRTIDRSDVRNAAHYLIKVTVFAKEGYEFLNSANTTRCEAEFNLTIKKKVVYAKAPRRESEQGKAVALTQNISINDLVCTGYVYGDTNSVWYFSSSTAKLEASVESTADGRTAGSFPIRLTCKGGNLEAQNYEISYLTGNERAVLQIKEMPETELKGANGDVVVRQVFDDEVTIKVDSIASANVADVMKLINGTTYSREAISIYDIILQKNEKPYVSDLSITIYLKKPTGNYSDISVYRIIEKEDGTRTYETVVLNNSSDIANAEFLIFETKQGDSYIIAGTPTQPVDYSKYYIIGGGVAAILFATVIAVALAKKSGKNKKKKKGGKGGKKPDPSPKGGKGGKGSADTSAKPNSQNWKPMSAAENNGSRQGQVPMSVGGMQQDFIPTVSFDDAPSGSAAPLDFGAGIPVDLTPVVKEEPEEFIPILDFNISETDAPEQMVPILDPSQIDDGKRPQGLNVDNDDFIIKPASGVADGDILLSTDSVAAAPSASVQASAPIDNLAVDTALPLEQNLNADDEIVFKTPEAAPSAGFTIPDFVLPDEWLPKTAATEAVADDGKKDKKKEKPAKEKKAKKVYVDDDDE